MNDEKNEVNQSLVIPTTTATLTTTTTMVLSSSTTSIQCNKPQQQQQQRRRRRKNRSIYHDTLVQVCHFPLLLLVLRSIVTATNSGSTPNYTPNPNSNNQQSNPRRLNPPPPPPPPSSSSSSLSSSEFGATNLIQHAAEVVRPPPPPPPPPPPRTIEATMVERGHPPPPPQPNPPPRRHDQVESRAEGRAAGRSASSSRRSSTLPRQYPPSPQHHPIPPAVSSPPPQSPQHPPPAASRRTTTTTSSSSLLKNVWGTVERGLDGLVRMDETLSGTAQNLPFWAAKKYWSSPSTVRAWSQEQAAAAAAGTSRSSTGGEGRDRWRPRTPRRRPSTTMTMVPQLSGVPLQPYGQKYQIAKKQKQQQTQRMETSHILRTANGGASSPYPSPPPNQHQQPPSSSSSVAAASASELPSRNNKKNKDDTIIVGGRGTRSEDDSSPNSSSSYNEQQQQQQQQYSRSFSSQPPTNGLFVPNLTTADARTENPPPRFVSHSGSNNDKNTNTNTNNIHNQIDQQKMHYDPSRPEAPNDHDQHSRQSRIPWATTSSTASSSSSASLSSSERYQDDRGGRHRPASSSSLIENVVPNGRRSTDYKYADARYDMPAWKRSLRRLSSPLKKLVPDLGQVFRFRIGRNRRDKYHASLEAWNLTETEDGSSDRRGFFRKLFRRRSRSDRLSSSSSSVPSSFRASSDHRGEDDGAMDGQSPSLIANMLIRCTEGKTASLLRDTDIRASTTIGRYQSVLDVLFIVSIIVGFKLMPGVSEQVLVSSSLPRSWEDIILVALPKVGSIFYELIQGSWSFFAFLYACLFRYVRERILDGKVDRLASSVASSVKEESEYSQLYLRLMAAIPMDRNLPNRLAVVSKKQVANVVSKARLDSYVGIVLASLMLMTASTVGPIILSFFSTIAKIVSLQELRHWPLQWQSIFSASSYLVKDLFQTLEGHTHNAVNALLNNPMQFAFHLSMFASLVICSLLPRLKERWAVTPASGSTTLEDGGGGDGGVIINDELTTSNFESAEEWSRIGTSSASRLSMLSENGSVENALARWRASRVTLFENSKSSLISNEGRAALSLRLQLLAYTIVVGLVTVVPLFVSHFLAGKGISLSSALSTKFTLFQWDSLLDVSFLQVFLFSLAYQALTKVTESVEHTSFVKEFQTDLVNTKEEMDDSNKRQTDFHSMGSVSPSAGILVRDLWAAHTSKRAWAVRGANFQCKNGEILAILGEDGSGKTRLLTTLAEALTFPPKRTNTTNKVRGFIGICGLEASKWDRRMLKRRLGIYLSDVRIIADSASLFSGWTMEEILEPVDGNRPNNDPLQRKLSPAERSSMFLALKITGLHGTLLARLPSKSLTIFTANEEDLRLTSLKPRSVVLSPGEWSKLILARVLAQTIYDNDNALSSNDKIESSLIGSILLLDDPTMMHSEVEEAQLLRDLRLTGAATVITTNKWATGRFVDQICVVKNGSVVEMGSHNELIARGPQQSLYAAKWHAMTVQ